jgi:hypothetical protein
MLDPKINRLDYGEQLSAPTGFEFDSAIATTYSLDLNALLAVPVALCFRDTLDGELKGEKLALLEGMGQLQGKLKVFYQKGKISYPSNFNKLFTLLEPCLHPVVPEGGAFSSFHPKLWLLRFIENGIEKKKPEVRYRLIFLSRNLTFDRSWDIAASLDGKVGRSSQDKSKVNTWLAFTTKLLKEDNSFKPAMAMLSELDKIKWELPAPFFDFELLIGESGMARPLHFKQDYYDELLVVSPFLKSTGGAVTGLDWLARLVHDPDGGRFLFSSAEELDGIGAENLTDWQCYAMNELIVNGEERNETGDSTDQPEIQKQQLHAKMIVVQSSNSACWHIGSANATAAAIGDLDNAHPRNTEAMLMLEGYASKVGPRLLMQEWMPEKGPQVFTPHEFTERDTKPDESNSKLVRQGIHQLISASWQLDAALDTSGASYTLTLTSGLKAPLNEQLEVTVEQLAIPGVKPLADTMTWETVALTSISALIPVNVKVKNSDPEKRLIIEANLIIEGGDKRHQLIMKEMVDTPAKVLDYIRLLLQVTPNKNQWLVYESQGGSGSSEFILSGTPILEQLLIATSRHPEILKRIASALKRLSDAGVEIPQDFLLLWKHFEKEIR